MRVLVYVTLFALLSKSLAKPGTDNTDKVVKKRQIYREQVLPHAGGKIPDTTFQTDRLLLNRLQKEGIAIPDGILLEQRNPQVHQYYNKASRPVFRVAVTSDGRYTPVEGRYVYNGALPSLETTYLYPQIHNYPLQRHRGQPIIPRYAPLQFPNPAATDNLQHLAKTPQKVYLISYQYAPSAVRTLGPPNSFVNIGSNSVDNFLLPTEFGQQDFITSQIFNDFDHFFNGFNFRKVRSTDKRESRPKSASIK